MRGRGRTTGNGKRAERKPLPIQSRPAVHRDAFFRAARCIHFQTYSISGSVVENVKNPRMTIFTRRILFTPDSDSGLPAPASPPSDDLDFSAPEPQPTPENDAASKTPAAANGLGERIRRRVAKTFAFTKGKGRPKKCRECGGEGCSDCDFTGVEPGKADGPASEPENPGDVQPAAPAQATSVVGSGPVANSQSGKLANAAIAAGIDVSLNVMDLIVDGVAASSGSDPAFSARVLEKARPKEDKMEKLTEAIEKWFEEEQVVIAKPGRTAALIYISSILVPYGNAIRTIKKDAAQRRLENQK